LKTHPFSVRKTPPAFVCNNACALSRATTLDIFLLENQRSSCRNDDVSCICDSAAHLLSKALHIADGIRFAIPPSELARLLPARAASENVVADRGPVKRVCASISKKFAASAYGDRGHLP
jgi:hypothetical protein